MATFPRTEADLMELTDRMVSGLDEYRDIFPSPPVNASEIRAAFDEFVRVSHEAQAAAFAAKEKYAEKDAVLHKLKSLVRANVRYAEGQARHDTGKLRLIGWGPRKQKSKSRPPGQVMGLEVVEEGTDWVVLRWKKPRDGGAVGAYKVMMCVADREWRLAESTANTEARLEDLEGAVTLSFYVIAINKVGEGLESSTVTAVLAGGSSAVPWTPPRTVVREQV
jgi:hypothetical protein